jgi:response regulator of citrate/malate metabolism
MGLHKIFSKIKITEIFQESAVILKEYAPDLILLN